MILKKGDYSFHLQKITGKFSLFEDLDGCDSMLNELIELFGKIDVVWCDNPGKEIHKSENYEKLMRIFPNLQEIHQEGIKKNQFEFNRTMRHIFRSFKVYYLLKQGNFNYELLSRDSLQQIRTKLVKFSTLNESYIPILLMYHDIGRFVDRKTHATHSSNWIKHRVLFEEFDLSPKDRLLLRKVIEYHLFLATIYTGESTFFGILSLLNDSEFTELLAFQNRNYAELFVDFLELFTYLDIFGYPYSRIFDHYLIYYGEINHKLKNLLSLWPNIDEIVSLAKQYAIEWTDWRLAGALRIFQFVKTKSYLTEEFYFNVLKESIRPEYEELDTSFQWSSIKTEKLSNIYKFQLKYALPFLMLLAFGQFRRLRLKENQTISPKLLQFWMLLSSEVKERGLNEKELVWNVYFENVPFWSEITKKFIEKLKIAAIKSIISEANLFFDKKKNECNLYLDFGNLTD